LKLTYGLEEMQIKLDMNTVRWGIIGCGSVTEVKSGPAFNRVNNSKLIAVCRRTPKLAEDYARRHSVPKWYKDPLDLIYDPHINAIYIATPPSSHKKFAILAAEANKAVYVEKPMALNFEECNEMILAASKYKVPLLVAYYRRRLPRFLFIERLLKRLGNIRFVNIVFSRPNEERYQDPNNLPWTVIPEISGGGLFVDLGSHTLDILDYLLGPIDEVKGFVKNELKAYPAEDSVALSFKFVNGIIGTGIWNFCSYERQDKIEITGDKGRVSFSVFGEEPIELKVNKSRPRIFNLKNPLHIQEPLIQTVVDHSLGRGECPSTGLSAARTQQVIDKALQSYNSRLLMISWDTLQNSKKSSVK
jgi:predicted dehydrogenase